MPRTDREEEKRKEPPHEPGEREQGEGAPSEGPPQTDRGERLEDLLRRPVDLEDKAELQKDYGQNPVIINVIQGNYVANSGSIYGGVSQERSGDSAVGGAEMETSRSLEDFFRPRETLGPLAALVVLATLELVPESHFFPLVQKLSTRLEEQDPDRPERTRLSMLQTPEELLRPFALRRTPLPSDGGFQGLTFQCLSFQKEGLSRTVRTRIWNLYPQLRAVLTDFFLALREEDADTAGRTVGYAAMGGLAAYAGLDLEYTVHALIPLLEQRCTAQRDVKYLTAFFKRLLLQQGENQMIDRLLCRWCEGGSPLLWQIPYRLYGQKGRWLFRQKVPKALRRYLVQDKEGGGRPYLAWFRRSRGHLLYPAHEDPAVAKLLVEETAELFSPKKPYEDRYQAAAYGLSLIRWDYLTDFAPEPRLVFLDALHQKEQRRAILPLLHFVWQRGELRGLMAQVLARHLGEIGRRGGLCSYLQTPFLYLAFQGSRLDYEAAQSVLTVCARNPDGAAVAEGLSQMLASELKKRTTARSREDG